MLARRFGLLATVMLTAAASTGCIQGLQLAEASLRLTGAIIEVAAAASASSSSSGQSAEANACCYTRANPTPVQGAVDRPMSECELARGRWRETHQDQNELPEELRCLANGSYPKITPPPSSEPEPVPAEPTVDTPPPAAPAAAPGDMI